MAALVAGREWPLVVVAGPTGSGKSALAMRIAEESGGEIVSCDSVAVYRGMDVGSAKPAMEDRRRVRHWCLDVYAPDEACTAGDWARAARAALADIRGRGLLPVIAGGTGLYLRALLEGLAPAPQRDEELRERLRARVAARGAAWLHRILARMDAPAAAKIHANDVPKVVRALEMALTARRPQTEVWSEERDALEGYRVLKLGLAPDRAELYRRIDRRVEGMFAGGLVEETAGLARAYGEGCRSLGSLGYAQAMAELRGELPRAEAVTATQQGHRNYAKRQGTWFRRESGMRWLDGFGDEAAVQAQAIEAVRGLVGDSVQFLSWKF